MVHHDSISNRDASGALPIGVPVQVRTRFDGAWASGFAVAEVVTEPAGDPKYRLKRANDGCVLPALFPAADVLPAAPMAVGNSGPYR